MGTLAIYSSFLRYDIEVFVQSSKLQKISINTWSTNLINLLLVNAFSNLILPMSTIHCNSFGWWTSFTIFLYLYTFASIDLLAASYKPDSSMDTPRLNYFHGLWSWWCLQAFFLICTFCTKYYYWWMFCRNSLSNTLQ